ncbi:hypothetical protein Ddye_029621 [Dipteronia dyeriana]|uniref:Uncharacterized protein n=1 Tax=Dipteronia dyeriana TaxID=168575 RepID=A0AAD9WKR8_9ROSI|nr:hypothetical protein Ddye_029621 [Dipteronia dyeriana]
MKDCDDTFCNLFGQQVSFTKSRIYCSSDIKEEARIIVNVYGSALTKNLCKYLGVLLFVDGLIIKHMWDNVCRPKRSAKAGWRGANSSSTNISITGISLVLIYVTVLFVLPPGKVFACGAKLVAKGLFWRVGCGAHMRFWIDHWVSGIGVLKDLAIV